MWCNVTCHIVVRHLVSLLNFTSFERENPKRCMTHRGGAGCKTIKDKTHLCRTVISCHSESFIRNAMLKPQCGGQPTLLNVTQWICSFMNKPTQYGFINLISWLAMLSATLVISILLIMSDC